MTPTVRTTSSMATDMISICGKSDFCEELAKIAQYDNVKANMMWNNYLNNHLLNMKKKKSKKEKEKERKFAKQVEDRIRAQIAREQEKQRQKIKTYKDAVGNQRMDHVNKQLNDAERKKIEDDQLKRDVARDNSRYYKKMNDMNNKKLNDYRKGLEEQVRNKNAKDRDESDLRRDISARNRNYLIDDAWKEQHRDNMKKHFQDGLVNQIRDKEDQKDWDRRKKEADDEQYRNDLQNANDADLRRRREIENAKRDIYLNEIKNQENQKKKQRDIEEALSNAENDKVRQKLVEDHLRHLDAEKKKKALMDDHLRKVEGQVRDLNDRKRKEVADRKKPHGTTLLTKGDYVAYEPDLQANLDMVEHKKRQAQKVADEDRKFANDVKQRNLSAIERDRLRDAEKLRVYQDGVRNQRDNHLTRKLQDMEQKKLDDDKWKNDVARDNDQYYKKMNDMNNKKLNDYRKGLEEQVRNKNAKDRDESDLRRDISARNRNYLIDDAWKEQHRDNMKKHFQDGLVNQIRDKEDQKDWDRRKKEADDEQYRNDLQNANDADLRRRREIENAKRDIYLNEIKNQENQKKKQRDIEEALSNAENDKVRQKLVEDHLRHLDAEKKKKALMDDHLAKVNNQLKQKQAKQQQDQILSKVPYGTGLLTKGDRVKYFDYLDCMQLYPLKNIQVMKSKFKKMQKDSK